MKMKKAGLFILCAVIAVSASVFSPPQASEAATADDGTKNYFQYDTYESGDYYEINYYLDIYKDTGAAVNDKCAGGGKTGTDNLFDSIEQFFRAYEDLFFNKTEEIYFRRASVKPFDSVSNPYYSFNMYVYFSGDAEKSAAKKYREYFGYGESTPVEPTKKSFFADKYEVEEVTHFFVPGGMPELYMFNSAYYSYDSIQQLAILNAVMMPFLLYGDAVNNGFADSARKIDYRGLINIFPEYFEGRLMTRSAFFENYILYHSLSESTVYVKTDADYKTGMFGEYTHAWEVSYAASPTDAAYANRRINITYIEPKVINMYFLAMIIAVSFAGLLLFCFYGIPKLGGKEKDAIN